MTKQKDGEIFFEFLIRWRNKAALMPNKPSERDQVRIIARNVHSTQVEKLQLMNPRNFMELYDDGLQVEEIESERRKTTKAGSSRAHTESTKVVEVNAVRTNRRFSNFNKPLSKVFERLEREGLLKPEPAKNPPNTSSPLYNPNSFCCFHQV